MAAVTNLSGIPTHQFRVLVRTKNEGLRAKNRKRARRFAFAAPPPPWRFNENVLETARDDDRPQEVSEILGVGDGRRGRRAGDTAQPNVARWGTNGRRLV